MLVCPVRIGSDYTEGGSMCEEHEDFEDSLNQERIKTG